MKKILIALVLICSLFITDTAMACKPAAPWPPSAKDNLAKADIAFIGTVQSTVQDKSVNGEYRISFTVDQAYKGTIADTVVVKTASSSAACGYDNGYETFKKGSVWMIYANGTASQGYTTNSLSLNTGYGSVALAASALTTLGIVAPKSDEPVMCTMQYEPVCGKSPSGETKTYGNSCTMGADKATFLYEGECKNASVNGSVTVTPSTVSTTDTDVSVNAETETGVVAEPAPTLNFWQRILLSIKTSLSFWK